jgi:hypothetical protein
MELTVYVIARLYLFSQMIDVNKLADSYIYRSPCYGQHYTFYFTLTQKLLVSFV